MREIKFKCYCLDDDFGKHTDCIVYENKDIMFISFSNMEINCGGDIIDINNKDVFISQYTGLKDKNGKEIYEGDIIEINDGDGLVIGVDIVKYENGSFNIACYSEEREQYKHYECLYEIIGNIYENPELLKDNK